MTQDRLVEVIDANEVLARREGWKKKSPAERDHEIRLAISHVYAALDSKGYRSSGQETSRNVDETGRDRETGAQCDRDETLRIYHLLTKHDTEKMPKRMKASNIANYQIIIQEDHTRRRMLGIEYRTPGLVRLIKKTIRGRE